MEDKTAIAILFEDKSLVVCRKPRGILSQGDGEQLSMETLLRRQCKTPVYAVHRLDRNVGGVMVFAKTRAAAANLGAQIQRGEFCKQYLAVTQRVPPEEGEWEDLLWKDSQKAYVVGRARKGVRPAKLRYRRLATAQLDGQAVSLCRIWLLTGRFHQIRVQFGSRGFPLVGDRKYGGQIPGELALHACSLRFCHPQTGQEMEFTLPAPDETPWTLFPIQGQSQAH